MIARALLEHVVRHVTAHLYDDLDVRLRDAMRASPFADRTPIGLAIGTAALALVRAFGPVERGLVVAPHDDGKPLPSGWRLLISAPPDLDACSLVAGDAAIELVARAPADRVIVALISEGASVLVESPLAPLALIAETVRTLKNAGGTSSEINAVRMAFSAIKGGELALHAAAPIATFAISDEPFWYGPTIGPWVERPGKPIDLWNLRRDRLVHAQKPLKLRALPVPWQLRRGVEYTSPVARHDIAQVIVPRSAFAERVEVELEEAGVNRKGLRRERFDRTPHRLRILAWHPTLAYGEAKVFLPVQHGEGGRMQQTALKMARELVGTDRSALAISTEGIDGPPPRDRPAPAGAFVDGMTWEAIRAAGIDPQAALDRWDAGTALAAVGALVITGRTSVSHGDLVVVG